MSRGRCGRKCRFFAIEEVATVAKRKRRVWERAEADMSIVESCSDETETLEKSCIAMDLFLM